MNIPHFFGEEIILENEQVRLEPLTEKHFILLLPIALHIELWEYTSAKVRTEADFRRYFDNALSEKNAGNAYPFAIFNKQQNAYAGSTRYGNISFDHKRVEIGWTWYHPAMQRSGINKAVKFLMLRFGFETLNLNRIELKTSSLNFKSQGAMLKIGAVKEGLLRSHMINEDGQIRDTVYFSFISTEWQQIKENIFKEFN